jgi:hypothetical protein
MFAVQTATEASRAKGASLATAKRTRGTATALSKAGTRVRLPYALPMLITYEIAFQKRILATT